eukprot:Em0001g1094a
MWDVYNHVADILLKMEQRRGSMKSLVFSLRDISLPAKKNIFALACRTLERKSVIDRVLESTSLLQKEPQLQYHLALVMVFDLLFGKCRLQCTGSIKRALMKHQAELLAAIAKELPKQQHSSTVIDSCAAPGNKTTHLASIMANQGFVYGICIDLRRLEKLSKFQEKILKHALSFPSVKRVLYSTCSVHKEENECVVERVLKEVQDSFELVHALPEWNRRGFPVFEEALKCIRIMPEDQTNGFFVAMFERKKQTSNVDGTVVCGSRLRRHSKLKDKILHLSMSRRSKKRTHIYALKKSHPFKRPHWHHKSVNKSS